MVKHCYKVAGQDLAFLLIPKCAATSIKAAVPLDPDPMYPHEAQDMGLFVATIVRHPLDRLVSAWANKTREITPGMIAAGYREGMSLEAFVMHTAKHHDLDHHVRPQTRFLYKQGRLCADFIGRFESLDVFWARLGTIFDLPELPHENKSERPHWAECYTDAAAMIARNTYHQDLRILGYR